MPLFRSTVTFSTMKSRFRLVAALFALSAFSLFWVEGVWASMCSTTMETASTTEMAGMDPASNSDGCPPGMTMPGSDSDQNRSEAPHCPLVPVGAASCVVGIPLAAESDVSMVPSPEGSSPLGSADHAKDLLLTVALFHPPRA